MAALKGALSFSLLALSLSALAAVAVGQSFDPLTPPGNVCPGSSTEYPPPGNIVANGFDNGVPAGWFCPFCKDPNPGLVIQSDGTSTYAAATADNRGGSEDAGVGIQVDNLVPGWSHLFYAWVRLTGAASQKNYGVIVRGRAVLIQGTFEGGPYCMAPVAQIQNDCWTLVKGAFTPPTNSDLLRISAEDRGANIHVRGVAVIPVDPNALRAQQNAQIDALRKANVQINFQRNGAPVSGGTVDFTTVRSGFPWGLQDVDYGVTYDAYQANFVTNIFRSSVVSQGNAGWPATESGDNIYDYGLILNFIRWAQGLGLPIIGPQVTWDDLENGIPQWVQSSIAATQANGGDAVSLLDYYISQRSTRAMNTGGGSYTAVTVDNEGIHKTYIPNVGGGIDSITKNFIATRSADNAAGHNTPIIYNEYNVGEGCYYNFPLDAYGDPVSPEVLAERINYLNSRGQGQLVNIAGLQFQVTPNQREDQRMSIAVSKVAEATGLPVHITELNVNVGNSFVGNYNFDRNLQADILESTLRQLFSNPHVTTILFQHVIPYPYGGDNDAVCGPCLFTSPQAGYQPNAAGQRYLALRDEWSTNVVNYSFNGGSAGFRAFLGTYAVTYTDPSGNKSPTQYITVNPDAFPGATQFVTLDV
ncbi:glycosyl hydrolase [Klebsormidium nitens]|uniref:Glycosyl hydrolase n=1 Tax=Klebsormidium nitens TaxID=105231 RepID=A0A1Y1HY65_KLENI|nr:glycosyl hydrolase [Klebsormidium nitens]|eukprot:GAQ81901.1 glycosyl hydrolase [Klebsormidium nitens]